MTTAKNSSLPAIIKKQERNIPKSERKAQDCIGPYALKAKPMLLIRHPTRVNELSGSSPSIIKSNVDATDIAIINQGNCMKK